MVSASSFKILVVFSLIIFTSTETCLSLTDISALRVSYRYITVSPRVRLAFAAHRSPSLAKIPPENSVIIVTMALKWR